MLRSVRVCAGAPRRNEDPRPGDVEANGLQLSAGRQLIAQLAVTTLRCRGASFRDYALSFSAKETAVVEDAYEQLRRLAGLSPQTPAQPEARRHQPEVDEVLLDLGGRQLARRRVGRQSILDAPAMPLLPVPVQPPFAGGRRRRERFGAHGPFN
jgi:hypothetical protein